MQPSDMDKKREAFLEHLKHKYPHHASAIMGHQERLREQSRSPKQGASCPSPVPALGDQLEQGSLASLDALEVMSECDGPPAFTRGSRSRASLPVVRSTNQTKDRSLGVLYLQYGDDTKQMRMPNEVTSVDTVRALFVSAFPLQLSMKMLESPSTAIYVKDDMRNMYYELSDVRSVADQACLKVYHKDPAQAFSHGPRPSNGDARMHREVVYSGRDGAVLMRQASLGSPPAHAMQGPMSPPTPHSMPPSPSRIPFGPRPPGPPGAAVPRERVGHTLPTPTRSASPCPSAILERRDVKPDEDVGSKSMSLPARGEGLYADPYMLHHHAPPPDALDHAYHRASIRSYGAPGIPMEAAEHHSLFRQKSRKYTESQLPTLGAKTPPPSPHRMGEMRMIDIHAGQSQSPVALERSSPVRQSFRKEAQASMDMVMKGRNALPSSVIPDFQAHCPQGPTSDPQTRDRTVKSGSPVHSMSSTGGSPVLGPRSTTCHPEGNPASASPISSTPLQVNLVQFRKNVSELRLQLQQMRQLQLQNQECVRAQMKQAEQEISVRLSDMLRRQEDPSHKQRVLVDEDRHKYLSMEERVLTQLGDLEYYVESLKRDSSPDVTLQPVTLKEVEEGAVSLRKVGEGLAGLKGDFPALQARMRAVLRVEVEAVKFLKEEPHKLDSMLKRVKTLTDALSSLRRSVTEGLLKPPDPVAMATSTVVDGLELAPSTDLQDPVTTPPLEPQSSSVRSEVINSNPMVIHHAQSSPVAPRQSQQWAAPSPTSAPPQHACEPAPSSTEPSASPAQLKKTGPAQPEQVPPSSSIGNTRRNASPGNGVHDGGATPILFIEELATHSKGKNRATSIEAAEREWEQKRQNMGHYDGPKFERMLQEAEANMLRGIPSLEVLTKGDSPPSPAAVPPTALEDTVEKPEPSAVPAQADSASSEKPPKTGPEKAPKPQLERPSKAVTLEKPSKPHLTAKTSLEKAAKPQDKVSKLSQGSDKASKSPPPPPPRRNYPAAPPATTGMTTTRLGEVIYNNRKEPGSTQEADKEPGSTPKPKVKSPPEVKPKTGSPPPLPASVTAEEEEEEEDDEGDKLMAELQNASVSSPTSRMPVPMSAKARQPSGTSDRERAAKQQKLQDSQRQFRQANGSAKRSGGDPKSTSPTMPASKIPAFSSSTGKGASQSESTNPVNSSIVPSSSSSSLSTNKSSISTHRSIPAPSSHIPSLSNGSLKHASAAHSAKGLSLSTQTPNGRPSSSSSSSTHSHLSPTMLAQGVKSIRTIHTPSFVSYNRPHNGSAGKSAIPMATATKDTS